MFKWREFAGGILVGVALASFIFLAISFWWMHHMFILGVASWPRLVGTLVGLLLVLAAGASIAFAGRRGSEKR